MTREIGSHHSFSHSYNQVKAPPGILFPISPHRRKPKPFPLRKGTGRQEGNVLFGREGGRDHGRFLRFGLLDKWDCIWVVSLVCTGRPAAPRCL